MADSGSSLAAALAWYDTNGERLLDVPTLVAAARERLRFTQQPCESCGGRKWPETVTCPSCGGSGEVWPAELVDIVAATAFLPVPALWHLDAYRYVRDDYRIKARAVLDALDLYATEATK